MLIFQVRNLLLDPSLHIPVEATWEIDRVHTGEEEVHFLEPWHIQGEIVNVGGDALEFSAQVTTSVQMACARCTKPVQVPLCVTNSAAFCEGPSFQYGSFRSGFLTSCRLRTIASIWEETILHEVQLGIPMKVLCKEDCKGLCPICGQDLNEGQCDCETDSGDPRWEALKGSIFRIGNRL